MCHLELQRRCDEASEQARIEGVENELRLQHNSCAATKDLLPYHNEAHLTLVGATWDLLQYYLGDSREPATP